MIGRVIFLSAAAFVAFRYIARSNKQHQDVAGRLGTTEVLPPVKTASPAASVGSDRSGQESAAVTPGSAESASILVHRSPAAEPDPRS